MKNLLQRPSNLKKVDIFIFFKDHRVVPLKYYSLLLERANIAHIKQLKGDDTYYSILELTSNHPYGKCDSNR